MIGHQSQTNVHLQWRSQPSVNVYSYLSKCTGPRAPKALDVDGGLGGFSPQENLKL